MTNKTIKITNVVNKFIKRLFDLCGSLVFLCLFSPVVLVISLMVRKKIGSPVFFCQERTGLNGKPFTIYKFRTMTEEIDEEKEEEKPTVSIAPSNEELLLTEIRDILKRAELGNLISYLIYDSDYLGETAEDCEAKISNSYEMLFDRLEELYAEASG